MALGLWGFGALGVRRHLERFKNNAKTVIKASSYLGSGYLGFELQGV